MNIKDQKEFPVDSAQLKEVRNFARGLFDQVPEFEDNREELVLALAEAAQNIVKHAYKDIESNNDKMEIKISLKKNDELEIGFFDKGKPVDGAKVRHRNIDDIKPGGLGTFFIQQIMDAVVFREGDKPWINHLILTKKL